MDYKPFRQFVKGMFSEGDVPSSSRVLTFWLSISSMALIWYAVRHAMLLTGPDVAVWVNGLPYLIGALTVFVASPYAINRGSSSIADIMSSFRKNKEGQQ